MEATFHSQPQTADFRICKLCGQQSGVPTYALDDLYVYRCRECDFHYLNRLDPPVEETPARLTERQQRYIENRLKDNARILTARLKLVLQYCTLSDRTCLDIGTGVGQFLQMLHAAGAFCQGIEPSGLRRQFAREQFGFTLSPQPAEDPFWHDQFNTFDLITLWDVLEHVNDPVATLHAAYALLKPGGWLFLETDNRDTASYRVSTWIYRLTRGGSALFLPNFYRPVPYGHKQIFRPGQLYDLASRCGFALIAANPDQADSTQTKPPGHRPAGQIVLVARKPH